jgi:hypothetical protein
MDTTRNTHRPIKTIHLILGVVYLVLLIAKFLYTEWDWVSNLLLLLVWGFALYLALKKRTIGEKFDAPTKVPAYSLAQRRCAWALIIFLPILGLAWIYYQSLPANKFIVAVADFQGPDPQSLSSYRTTVGTLASSHQGIS